MSEVRYVSSVFASGSDLLARGVAAIALYVSVCAAAALTMSVMAVFKVEANHGASAVIALGALAALWWSLSTALNYLAFLWEGGYLRVLPRGLQFRDRWYCRHTVAWSDLIRVAPETGVVRMRPDGRVRTHSVRVGFGVIDPLAFLDALSHYRPDIAAHEAQTVLDRMLAACPEIDLLAASRLAGSVPGTAVIARRMADIPSRRHEVLSVILSPSGVTSPGPYRWSRPATLPWSAFCDARLGGNLPAYPGPTLILLVKPERLDSAVMIPLNGLAQPEAYLAICLTYRPDLDAVGSLSRRIAAWRDASSSGGV